MTDLLQLITLPSSKKGALPLFLEFSINDELKPFLVSSTRGVIWIYRTKENRVRAAIRKDLDKNQLYTDLLAEIMSQGKEYSWGNVFEGGLSAISRAKSRMIEYGFTEVEILTGNPAYSANKDLTFSSGIPTNLLVVVPKDREYLGFLGTLQENPQSFCVLVHNASRGICIITP
jgi:hypothetical protein